MDALRCPAAGVPSRAAVSPALSPTFGPPRWRERRPAAPLANERRGITTAVSRRSRCNHRQPRPADRVGLGLALVPAAPHEVTKTQAFGRDVMIDGGGGNVEDDRPGPARGETDGQLSLFAAARIGAHAPDRLIEAAHLEREIGPHAHTGADGDPHLAGGFWQSPVAAANYPVKLCREP